MYLCHGMTPQVSAFSLALRSLLTGLFLELLITQGHLGGGLSVAVNWPLAHSLLLWMRDLRRATIARRCITAAGTVGRYRFVLENKSAFSPFSCVESLAVWNKTATATISSAPLLLVFILGNSANGKMGDATLSWMFSSRRSRPWVDSVAFHQFTLGWGKSTVFLLQVWMGERRSSYFYLEASVVSLPWLLCMLLPPKKNNTISNRLCQHSVCCFAHDWRHATEL